MYILKYRIWKVYQKNVRDFTKKFYTRLRWFCLVFEEDLRSLKEDDHLFRMNSED